MAGGGASIEQDVERFDLRLRTSVPSVGEVEAYLGDVGALGGDLGGFPHVRLGAAAVREPPGMEAHA